MSVKGIRVLIPFLCLLVPLHQACGQVKAHSESVTVQIRKMKTVAVQIRYRSNAPNPQAGAVPFDVSSQVGTRAGTGFFVSPSGYVLTAGHVIRSSEKAAREKGATNIVFRVGILLDTISTSNIHFSGSFSWVDANVVDVDEVHDLALLKVSQNPFNGGLQTGIVGPKGMLRFNVSTARINPRLPADGENLLVSGYPLEIPTFVTQRGMVASQSFYAVEVPVPNSRFTRPESLDSIILDAVVNPGNSGGPVYDSASGDVVGICDAYELAPLVTNKLHSVEIAPGEFLNQNSGLAVVVPVKYALELLRKNGVTDFLLAKN
jgi:S1-C subfamily serine protease